MCSLVSANIVCCYVPYGLNWVSFVHLCLVILLTQKCVLCYINNIIIAWIPISLFRCSFQRNCTIEVNTETFGDPCPGTIKYIEAQYKCEGNDGILL